MTASSNLYANSIFSEHPIALYSLDDDVRYISLISDTQRLFNSGGWSASANNSASVSFNDSPTLPILPSPFDSNIYSQISASVISNNTTIEIKSPQLFSFNELNQELATFAISCFLYQSSSHVNWYEFGYTYYDNITLQNINVVNRVEAEEGNAWINFDFSFLPEEYDSNKLKIIFRINLDAGGPPEDYRFIVNGLCIGQWAETFSTTSLGNKPVQNSLGYKSVPAYEYGIQEDSGYYLIENNKLLAKNDGMPLVYGSTSCTKLYAPTNEDMPSIIFPSKGFLTSSGKNSEYTLEFWMNVKPTLSEDRKIFGTLDNNHGIYINNAFISIKVGEKIASYPVSEWYRPMIIHFSLSTTTALLMINGEVIITLAIDSNDRELYSSQDWIAFYTYSDIEYFVIECLSIYSYIIPTQVATRRFVYGQGTPSPDIVAEAFDGKTMYVNYSNANYNVNKIYPDTSNWEGGYSENLKVKKSSISFPEYSLPEIYIGGRDINDLYTDNKTVNDLEGDIFFTFRPHISNNEFVTEGTKWTEPGYIYFNSLGIIDSLSAIYGVFSTKNISQTSTLALITKSNSTDNLHIYLENGKVKYSFNDEVLYSENIGSPYFDYYDYYNNVNYLYGPEYFYDYVYNQSEYETRFGYNYSSGYYYFDVIDSEYSFAFGLKIKDFITNYGYLVTKFFESPNNLQVYFGGNKINTFDGKIHSIGLCNSTNVLEIPELFNSDGIVDISEYEDFTNHFATYTLKPLIRFDQFLLDISVSSLWQEYLPLSIFTKYIDTYEGTDKYYDLDYLQINLGYPSAYEVIEKLVTLFNWNYVQLFDEYNYPIQQGYNILNNEIISGYETYEDLKIKRELDKFLNTSQSSLRSYITFQLLSEGANQPLSSFPYTRDLVESKYIDAELLDDPNNRKRPYLTKFEFVDNTIVFPPKYFNVQDIAAVFHFVLKHEGILSNPLFVRDFEVVSRVLDHNTFNALGSETGVPFYSYIKTGIYYENKTKNPMTINKKRLPYLYVTENSGVKLLGKQDFQKEHGIAIPINQEKAQDYNIKAMQLWIKSNQKEISPIEHPIFEIESLDKTIEFIIKSDPSNKRGMITARNKNTRLLESGIIFYQNGNRVKTPVIEYNQWNSLGISFFTELSFSEYTGYINLFREASFNNVSYYKTSGLGKSLELIKRPWRRVLTDDDIINRNWSSWYLKDNTVATTTRVNIANNPNFELNLNNWTPNGIGTTIERITTDAKYGTSSLKCTTGSENNSGVLFANESGQRLSITPQTEYTISVYVKIPSGSPDKTLRLRIREYEQVSGGTSLPIKNQIPVTFSSLNGWGRLSYTFTSDTNANALGIEINQEIGNQVGDIFYVDALLIENSTSLSPKVNKYFDGDLVALGNIFKSVVWNGAANNSSSTAVVYVVQSENIRQWVDVYAIGESIIFALTPQDIYKSYIGKNGFVVDDNTSLILDADSMHTISDARWSRFSDIPS